MMARSTNAPFSVTEPTSKDCPVTIGGVAAALDYGNKSFGSSSRSPQTFFQIAFARSTIASKSIEQSGCALPKCSKTGTLSSSRVAEHSQDPKLTCGWPSSSGRSECSRHSRSRAPRVAGMLVETQSTDQGHRRRHVRRAVYCPAAVTLHTVLPTSSAISKAPVLSIATPTGRPRASPFAFCTTCRIACCAPARNSYDEADTIFGEPCRFKHWPDVLIHVWREEMTAFSRSNFNDASRVKGLERTYGKFPAVISSRCRMPKD